MSRFIRRIMPQSRNNVWPMGTIHRPGTHWNLLLLSSTLQSAIQHSTHHITYLQNIKCIWWQHSVVVSVLASINVINTGPGSYLDGWQLAGS